MAAERSHVLHLISQLSLGGGTRAALTVAKYSARLGPYRHQVISLLPAIGRSAILAREAGVKLLEAPTASAVREAIARADIVQAHFWNTPELYELFRSDWPSARLLIWLDVAGDTAPQVVTAKVAAFGDLVVAGCPYTAELPVLRERGSVPAELVTAAPDLELIAAMEPTAHDGFNVGYIGTVAFEKMHPDFVALHARIDVPQARFIVCGIGGAFPTLRQQATQAGAAERFDLRGYVGDLRPILSVLDVFGYPLRPDNYSAAELALREAMFAGIPPVVFPFGGAGQTVTHNVTGLIASDAAAYGAAIEWLYRNPDERARLGRNARAEASAHFRPEVAGEQFNALYAELLRSPKRRRTWPGLAGGGAEHFIESLGNLAADFVASRRSADLEACLAAETRIAAASALLASATAGGVLHYRRAYPNDAYLRLWAGLVLQAQGRPALAVGELTQAMRLGLDHWRVAWYLALAAEACGALERAETLAATVLEAVPTFTPAQDFARGLQDRRAARPRAGPR